MLNKLRNKIFWILQISFTGVVLGIIILYFVLNYKTTMETVSNLIDRYTDHIGSNADDRENLSDKEEVYTLFINNSEIIENPDDATEEVQELAIKVSNSGNTTGIIENYIYKLNEKEKDSYIITIARNDTITTHIRNLIIFSCIAFLLSVIIIFLVSKKVSTLIVKPVKETFEKQKQFISDASHELKTPLSIISINAEMTEKKLGKNKWLNYILSETESMNKLINTLLLLAETENPDIENQREYFNFDLSREIEDIIATFEIMASDKNLQLNTNIIKNVNIKGCPEDIKHIVSTILDNAIKHTKSGKEILVELSKEKNENILQIKNQGEPIPQEEKDKIFERFYRIDKSRNRNEKRYGLGLAIARATVEKYSGKIEVECENGWTNFKVTLYSKK